MQMQLINVYARVLLCAHILVATPLLFCCEAKTAEVKPIVRFVKSARGLQQLSLRTLLKTYLQDGQCTLEHLPLKQSFLELLTRENWALLWNRHKQQLSRCTLQTGTMAHAGMFALDGSSLVTCTSERKLYLWDLSSGASVDENDTVLLRLENLDSDETTVEPSLQPSLKLRRVSADVKVEGDFPRVIFVPTHEGHFYLGLLGKEIQEWEYKGALNCLSRVSCHLDALAVSPCGKMLLIGLVNGPAFLIEAAEIRGQTVIELAAIADHKKIQLCSEAARHGLSLSANGRWAAISTKDGAIEIWDVKKLPPVRVQRLMGHSTVVASTSFYPGEISFEQRCKLIAGVSQELAPLAGMRLLSAGDSTVRLWDLISGKSSAIGSCPVREFPVQRPYIPTKVEFSQDGAVALIIYESEQYADEHRSQQGFGCAVGCIDCVTNEYILLYDERSDDNLLRQTAIPALHPTRKTLLIPGSGKTELIALQDYEGRLSFEQVVESLRADLQEEQSMV